MILNRIIFHAKFGHAAQVVEMLKQSRPPAGEAPSRMRLLTDRSGRFDTVVLEIEAESMADHDRMRAAMFAEAEDQQQGSEMVELIEWGEQEFWTIEHEDSSA
jgi:hypothetical protein